MDNPELVLSQLAIAVAQAVHDVDLRYDLHAAMKSVTVTCNAVGAFSVQIDSDLDVDQQLLHELVLDGLGANNGRSDETRAVDHP